MKRTLTGPEVIVDIVRGMDLKCQVYGDQDLTCIEYDTDDYGKRMGADELCDHCRLYEALEAMGGR